MRVGEPLILFDARDAISSRWAEGIGQAACGKIHVMDTLSIIGGGLAGCEAAWQAAQHGVRVRLFEMRPQKMTGAHSGGGLAELICSNSLGAKSIEKASGLLKDELRQLGSLLLACGDQTALPAGGALAVDRELFSELVSEKITQHPLIEVVREESREIPQGPVIIASGPLTSESLAQAITRLTGQNNLFFYDALAPIVTAESINMEIAFRASRYEFDSAVVGDYINCPFTDEQYHVFVTALVNARRIELKPFEAELRDGVKAGDSSFFEACLPVEVLAGRNPLSLSFGPMKPVGIHIPNSDLRPAAVLQLRQDNLAGSLYNLVGFQTNLTYADQDRVFRMIPGLENAEFVRYGQMHRNTYLASPLLLNASLEFKERPGLFFAGQITGVEGYMGNIGTGWLAGVNAARWIKGEPLVTLPKTIMLGALCHYITHAEMAVFQPMKANFGLLPELPETVHGKRNRRHIYTRDAQHSLEEYLNETA